MSEDKKAETTVWGVFLASRKSNAYDLQGVFATEPEARAALEADYPMKSLVALSTGRHWINPYYHELLRLSPLVVGRWRTDLDNDSASLRDEVRSFIKNDVAHGDSVNPTGNKA